MDDAECPVCMNTFKFEGMRSLVCGHTYCSSCVEQLINTPHFGADDVLRCPECRHPFEPKHVRRLFITPSTSNNKSATQTTPSGSAEEDGFIKQATHIANRLQKIDADTPAQSLKTAVDIMEHVATIQNKRAQEILWKAVREFWLDLVPFFEQWRQYKALPDQVSALQQHVTEVDQRCVVLELAVESQHKERQLYSKCLRARDREIAEIRMTLRDANEKITVERERYRVLLARHSASETKYRAQVKQLKKEHKSRERESVTGKLQLEEESLVVEPGYHGTRSHRLNIYNDPGGSRHRKLPPEESARGQNSDDRLSANELDSLTSPHSSPQSELQRGRGRAKRYRRNDESSRSPSLRRPQFGSDWNLPRLRPRPQKLAESESLPLQLDSRGKPKGLLQRGPRVRMKTARHP